MPPDKPGGQQTSRTAMALRGSREPCLWWPELKDLFPSEPRECNVVGVHERRNGEPGASRASGSELVEELHDLLGKDSSRTVPQSDLAAP
jgi:hypothetical protein